MIGMHVEILRDSDPKSPTFKKLLFEVTKNRFGHTGKTYVVGLNERGLYAEEYEEVAAIEEEEDEVVVAEAPNIDEPKRKAMGPRPAPASSGFMPTVVPGGQNHKADGTTGR